MQAEVARPEPGIKELKRIRQIAKEEAAAARAGDAETVCRLTELLPQAVADCQAAIADSDPQFAVRNSRLLDDIRAAHEQAQKCLEEQMAAVRLLLQQCTTARRTLRAYGKKRSAAQLDNQS